MKSYAHISRSIWLLLGSVLLSALTVVFGAAPLKTVRRTWGAGPFWLLGLGLAGIFVGLKMSALAVVILLYTVAVGVWVELEDQGLDLAGSAMGALLCSGVAAFSLFYLAIAKDKTGWYKKLIAGTENALAQVTAFEPIKNLKIEDLVMQLPSLVMVCLVLALAFAAIFERPISAWAGIELQRRERLTDFRLPDFVIWAVIGAVFGAFWNGSPKVVQVFSLNVLNVCVVLYFFQGMAVLCKYFEVFRVSAFWRTVLIAIFSLQLFFVLSLIGVVDFWVDFRKMFTKKSSGLKKRRLSE